MLLILIIIILLWWGFNIRYSVQIRWDIKLIKTDTGRNYRNILELQKK